MIVKLSLKGGCRGFSESTLVKLLEISCRGSIFCCRNKIATGSFDKTLKIWDAESGDCLHTCKGHLTEIVST